MTRVLLFCLVGLISFLGYIVVQLPAAPFWNMARDDIQANVPGLHLLGVNGRVWQGKAEMQYLDFPISQLDWQIHGSRLLGLKLSSDLRVEGEGHQLDADVSVSPGLASILNLHGFIDAAYINSVSQAQGLIFSGRITGTDLDLVSDHHWLTSASGKIRWPGGDIIIRQAFSNAQTVRLPALVGEISMIDQTLWLHIYTADEYKNSERNKDQALINIAMKPNGMASVIILARLFEIANLPFIPGLDPSDPVLEFEEKIF